MRSLTRITTTFLLLSCFTFVSTAQTPREKLQIIDNTLKQDTRGNYSIEGLGTIKLKDGSLIDGHLLFTVTTSLGSQGRVQLFSEKRMTPEDFYPSKVEYFMIGEHVFYPLDVKFEGANYVIFAQTLNINLNDKMTLYRLYIATTSTQGNTSPFLLKKGYFIKMKNSNKATQLGGMSLKPFYKSMSEDVADCPDLAKKIKEKEEGYKTSMLDLDSKNDDVYFKIMEEYNTCK